MIGFSMKSLKKGVLRTGVAVSPHAQHLLDRIVDYTRAVDNRWRRWGWWAVEVHRSRGDMALCTRRNAAPESNIH
jgi:hypothetical protein